MQCQICKKDEATIHLTEINDGARTELHICEQCAIDQGIAIKSNMPINELLSNLLSVQPTDDEILGHGNEELACLNCGFTIEKFRKEAVLGCPNDYEVFENALLPLIKKAHDGKTSHCGKVPSKLPSDLKEVIEISGLKRQLEEAVKAENYEQAAKLRDKINQAEKKNK
jgi:protein arginine kinase activator